MGHAGSDFAAAGLQIDGAALVGLLIFAGMALFLLCTALCSKRHK